MQAPWTRLGLRWSKLRAAERAALIAAAAFVAWFFARTCVDAVDVNGIDLRAKVVGARAILHGVDPYAVKWKPDGIEDLFDPARRIPGPTRTTYPPPLLLLYVALAPLDYRFQRFFWYGAEWIAMLAAVFVAARLATTRAAKVAFLSVAAFFFVGDWLFRLHVERGQYYAFVVLLLSAAFVAIVERRDRWPAAIAIGVSIAFRPTLGLIALVLAIAGRPRTALRAIAVAAALCLVTVPLVGVQGWRSFLDVVRFYWTTDVQHDMEATYGPAIPLPEVAEGLDLVHYLAPNGGNVTFRTLYSDLVDSNGPLAAIGAIPLRPLANALGLAFSAATLGLAWLARKRNVSIRWVLVLAMGGALGAEFFLAPIRWHYGDVMLLPIVALLLPVLLRVRALAPALAALLLGLALASSFIGFSEIGSGPLAGVYTSWVRNLGVAIAATSGLGLALASARRRATRPAPSPARELG